MVYLRRKDKVCLLHLYRADVFRSLYPINPPRIEAAKIPTLACTICVASAKARVVTNIDMVNPIDARKPSPSNLRRVIERDSSPKRNRVSNHTEKMMPIGLPSNKPNITPMAT